MLLLTILRFSGRRDRCALEPEAAVLDGYAIASDRVADSKDGVLTWLEKTGMKD